MLESDPPLASNSNSSSMATWHNTNWMTSFFSSSMHFALSRQETCIYAFSEQFNVLSGILENFMFSGVKARFELFLFVVYKKKKKERNSYQDLVCLNFFVTLQASLSNHPPLIIYSLQNQTKGGKILNSGGGGNWTPLTRVETRRDPVFMSMWERCLMLNSCW